MHICDILQSCEDMVEILTMLDLSEEGKPEPSLQLVPVLCLVSLLTYLCSESYGVFITDESLRQFWTHAVTHFEWGASHPGRYSHIPVGVYGDEARYTNSTGYVEKVVTLVVNLPLWCPRTTRSSRFIVFTIMGIPHGRVQRDTLADIWTSVTAVEPLIPWRHWGQIVRRPVPVEKVEICPHRDQGWLVLALRCLAIGSQVVQYPVLFQMPSNIQTGTVSVHGLYRSCSMGAAPIYPCAICCNNVETWPNMSLDTEQTAGSQIATFPVFSSSHWWDLPDPASL